MNHIYDICGNIVLRNADKLHYNELVTKFINSEANKQRINFGRYITYIYDLVVYGQDFTESNFSQMVFRNCKFIECNFTDCIFWNSDLNQSHFQKCTFLNTNFNHAEIEYCFITECSNIIDIGCSSRGYRWIAVKYDDGLRIKAGCRWFTQDEATAHWYGQDSYQRKESKIRMNTILQLATLKGWQVADR